MPGEYHARNNANCVNSYLKDQWDLAEAMTTLRDLANEEDREGESLFHTWRVRSAVKHAKRMDGVLATSIRRGRTRCWLRRISTWTCCRGRRSLVLFRPLLSIGPFPGAILLALGLSGSPPH